MYERARDQDPYVALLPARRRQLLLLQLDVIHRVCQDHRYELSGMQHISLYFYKGMSMSNVLGSSGIFKGRVFQGLETAIEGLFHAGVSGSFQIWACRLFASPLKPLEI